MPASRIAALTLATGALVAAAGPAFADHGGSGDPGPTNRNSAVVIDQNPVAAGDELAVGDGRDHTVICKPGTKSATAWSDGFKDGRADLSRKDDASWGGQSDDESGLVGYGLAAWQPGWYDVKLTCDGDREPSGFGGLNVVPQGVRTGDGAPVLAVGASDAQKDGTLGVGAFRNSPQAQGRPLTGPITVAQLALPTPARSGVSESGGTRVTFTVLPPLPGAGYDGHGNHHEGLAKTGSSMLLLALASLSLLVLGSTALAIRRWPRRR